MTAWKYDCIGAQHGGRTISKRNTTASECIETEQHGYIAIVELSMST